MIASAVVRKARALAARGLRLLKGPSDLFERFQDSAQACTWKDHDRILDWAIRRADEDDRSSPPVPTDPLVARGLELKRSVESAFRAKHVTLGRNLRILVHLPDFEWSPGGYSLFGNMISSLNFLGIPAEPLKWGESLQAALGRFEASCILTSDHESFLNRIDWDILLARKKRTPLLLGLTASPDGDGNTPLEGRLAWARKHAVDFYYNFQAAEYVRGSEAYSAFFRQGYPVFSVEFGANLLHYYPVEKTLEDLDYVLLASSNPDKLERYLRYLGPILRKYKGFIDGPGWKRVSRYAPARTHRYLYSRGRVGINLHIPSSIESQNELNERTYILAACGVPQVIDKAQLLPQRFSSGCFFVAASPSDYLDAFVSALREPQMAREKARHALEEVFARHTTYHRMDAFVRNLKTQFGL